MKLQAVCLLTTTRRIIDSKHSVCYISCMNKIISFIIATTGLCLYTLGLYYVGFQAGKLETISKQPSIMTSPTSVPFPTGYEVWNELNAYRKSLGIKPMILDERLCNNIAQRAIDYEKNNSHEGFEQFHASYMSQIRSLSEVLTYGKTAQEVISDWKNSPSHDTLIREKGRGCAYSDRGYSVVLMTD